MEKPDYKPVAQQIDDILLDEDLALDGVVDIDIDDFLSGMSTTGLWRRKFCKIPINRVILMLTARQDSNKIIMPPI